MLYWAHEAQLNFYNKIHQNHISFQHYMDKNSKRNRQENNRVYAGQQPCKKVMKIEDMNFLDPESNHFQNNLRQISSQPILDFEKIQLYRSQSDERGLSIYEGNFEQKINQATVKTQKIIEEKEQKMPFLNGKKQQVPHNVNKPKLKLPESKSKDKQDSNKAVNISYPPSHNKNNMVVTRGVEFVPVDQYFSKRQQVKVFYYNKAFYSITLSQSNLAKDDNKFFIVQLLVAKDNPEHFYLFSRWGRVGVIGQMAQSGILQRKSAIRQYNAKTQSKVKNGGYRIVQMSYEHDQERQDFNINQFFTKNSTLPDEVQELMRLIFDIKMMQAHMRQIGYDQKRSPLGLIAKSAIEKGYIALDNILKVLKSEEPQMQKRKELNEYSSQFYSAIPHDFGYMNMKAFVLNTEQKVKQKLQMLSSLSQIQIYSNLMRQKVVDEQLPDWDIQYSKLKCDISPLPKDASIYPKLLKYLKNTHAKTHDKYSIQLVQIFSLKRPQEEQNYQGHIGNKMLLWHGSRLTNFVGILSQGLKIAPYQAPSTGYMFGKGIYFADISSKAANYCLPKTNSCGLMLLCQVALGQMNDKLVADYTAHNLPPGKHSTRGVGKYAPANGQMYDGVLIPNGQLISTGIQETSLLYNEYTVYSREQIKCRFIVQVNFVFKK